jgi:hypothetical protein
MMQTVAIHPSQLDQAWPVLEPLIARVCAFGGEWHPSKVLISCMNQSAQLWAVFDESRPVAAAVTEILDKDLRRDCNIWLCAGSYSDEARDSLLREVEDWARRIGCERIQLVGRRGWEKKLPAYRRTRVILEKRL